MERKQQNSTDELGNCVMLNGSSSVTSRVVFSKSILFLVCFVLFLKNSSAVESIWFGVCGIDVHTFGILDVTQYKPVITSCVDSISKTY